MVNNIFLYKRFIGVKKINGHSGVNFSFNWVLNSSTACSCTAKASDKALLLSSRESILSEDVAAAFSNSATLLRRTCISAFKSL